MERVSKKREAEPAMTLFQAERLKVVTRVLDTAKIPPADVKADLRITQYGERMALSIYLPDKYEFDPGDKHPMALRLECQNSVDGSTRFRALMGWFRFVCCSDIRRRHVGDFQLEDVGKVLTSGLEEAEVEKKNFESWRKTGITRAFHIARCGHDADVIGQYNGKIPTGIAMAKKEKPVPGAPAVCRNLFDLSQILAWLAKERRDVQEQLKWREQIPELLEPLKAA